MTGSLSIASSNCSKSSVWASSSSASAAASASGSAARMNRRTIGKPIVRQEHVLGPTQSDALGAELTAMARIAFGVGVDAHLHVAGGDGVGPGEQRVELGRRRRPCVANAPA